VTIYSPLSKSGSLSELFAIAMIYAWKMNLVINQYFWKFSRLIKQNRFLSHKKHLSLSLCDSAYIYIYFLFFKEYLRILICVILCLEFWKARRTRCKQCVKYMLKMNPRVEDLDWNCCWNKEHRFSLAVTRRLHLECPARSQTQPDEARSHSCLARANIQIL